MFDFEGSHNEISETKQAPDIKNKPSDEVGSLNDSELEPCPEKTENEEKTAEPDISEPEEGDISDPEDPNEKELLAPEAEHDPFADIPESDGDTNDNLGTTEKNDSEVNDQNLNNDRELPLFHEQESGDGAFDESGRSPEARTEESEKELSPSTEKTDPSDKTDWERTSLTPEQERQMREMDEEGELDIPEVDPDWEEPEERKKHLPTNRTGRFEGERGNSAFYPNNEEALEKMKEYGQDHVDYRDGNPDFSPFTKYNTPFGEIDGQIEIPHMTDNRENPSWEHGRRPDGTKHDPHYDLGNFTQADYELSKKMGEKMSPAEIEKFRKDNNLTWHECPDGKTMQLVPSEIHDACRHSGGVSEQKYRQAWGDITAPY